jgi:hypothetical protein
VARAARCGRLVQFNVPAPLAPAAAADGLPLLLLLRRLPAAALAARGQGGLGGILNKLGVK